MTARPRTGNPYDDGIVMVLARRMQREDFDAHRAYEALRTRSGREEGNRLWSRACDLVDEWAMEDEEDR